MRGVVPTTHELAIRRLPMNTVHPILRQAAEEPLVEGTPSHGDEAVPGEPSLAGHGDSARLARGEHHKGRDVAPVSSSVWTFTAPLALRKRAQGNRRKPKEMVVLSKEKSGLLNQKPCPGAKARQRA